TSGATPSAAVSQRRRRAELRSPGTSPKSAKQTASRTEVLPAPVAPVSRKRPASESTSKSTSTRSGKGPKAWTERWCSRTSTGLALEVAVGAARVAGVLEQGRLLNRRGDAAHLRHEVEGDLVVGAARGGHRARRAAAQEVVGGEGKLEGVREPGSKTLHRPHGPHLVGERGLYPRVLGVGESRRGEQLLE